MNKDSRKNPSIFEGLITSKTKIRILMRLFLNPGKKSYIREMAGEFNLSPSIVKEELHQLERAGLLASERAGRQILYQANTGHVLFPELNSMVRKAMGMDRIVDSILARIGDLELALLLDDYAEGKDSGLIDLVLVGEIDRRNADDLVRKTEKYIDRRIRVLIMSVSEYNEAKPMLSERPHLIIWHKLDTPSTVGRGVV
ncbi:MAG: winged helix-turn-helix domain-containing protein [Gammaproteobacteria bacterium]|nr:winged helix-turn-helix domain-containing protein [Gammaproteobacteria bacterium]